MTPRSCTPKEETFCLLYVANGRNGAAAAEGAGYSKKRAKVTASELLTKGHIQERVQSLAAAALHQALEQQQPASTVTTVTSTVTTGTPGGADVTAGGSDRPSSPPSPASFVSQAKVDYLRERIIDELAAVGLARMTDVASWTEQGVEFIPSAQLSPEAVASIASVEADVSEGETPDGKTLYRNATLKVKQHSKLGALGKLAELLDMAPKKEAPAAGAGGAGVTVIVAGGATGLELAAAMMAPALAQRAVAIVSAPEIA